MTGNPVPQLGMGSTLSDGSGTYLLDKLDGLSTQLGFSEYTNGNKSILDVFAITLALMVGTAGLPHVIVRFFTVKKVRDARMSAGYALLFIAVLYTTAPAVAVFAKTNLINTVQDKSYAEVPDWFRNWENTALLGWIDKNNDGKIQYGPGKAADGKPIFADFDRGAQGERIITNPSSTANELFVDRDIMVLANPEIARLPNWVIALVASGGLAAALSTAAGLLLVISSAVSHDLIKKMVKPDISERGELVAARLASVLAVCVAGYFGINPPGFVAAVVALAFGLAAASFFPAIFLGVFYKRMNKEGAILGMVVGTALMLYYMLRFKLGVFTEGVPPSSEWWFGISPEGFGTVAMLVNFAISLVVCHLTPAPAEEIQDIVENIRIPSGAGEAVSH